MTAVTDPPPDRRKSLGRRIRDHRIDYLFMLPGLAVFGAFIFWPLVAANWYALLDWSGFTDAGRFIGLQNYRELLQDEFFIDAFGRSMLFTALTVPLQMVLGLVFAVVLNNRLLKLSAVFRTMIFLPVVTPVAVIAIVMALMLSPFNGPINDLVVDLNLSARAIDFLGSSQLAMWSLAGIYVWKWTGVTLIYWLAALQTVPDELYEASRLDGITGWQVTLFIILPIIAPFAVVIALISAISALNVFPLIQATTQGGPYFASEVMEVFIFRTAFAPPSGTFPQLGYASAAGVLFGVAVMGITILQAIALRHARRKDPTNE